MSISTFERNATIAEMAVEMDRRGAVIERLEAENERLREALKAFAEVAEHDIGEDETDVDFFRPMERHNRASRLRVGDLRRARAALSTKAGE